MRVIRAWVGALQRGELGRAARYFAVPITIAGAGPAYTLRSRREVVRFHASVSCGAELLGAVAQDRYTIARLRLTERPGARCGAQTGTTVSNWFRVRRGRIVEWRSTVAAPTAPARPRIFGPSA